MVRRRHGGLELGNLELSPLENSLLQPKPAGKSSVKKELDDASSFSISLYYIDDRGRFYFFFLPLFFFAFPGGYFAL